MKKFILFVFVSLVVIMATGIVIKWNRVEQNNKQVQTQIAQAEEIVKAEPPPVKKTVRIQKIYPPPKMATKPIEQNDGQPNPAPMAKVELNICTDLDKAAKTGCRFVTQEEYDFIVHGKPIVKKTIIEDDTERREFIKQQQVNVELIGILKLQLNEQNSWNTILQMLVLLLCSYGGVKFINKKFE